MNRSLILLTNDDGFSSPGLWAAAAALEPLGEVLVVAPRQQQSGAGRSMPRTLSGRIYHETVEHAGRTWQGYAVEASPAQAVLHGLLEIAPRRPDLLVAGINYGENVGVGVTISGTVGAALEGAAFGVRGLAVSIEAPRELHESYSTEVCFDVAAHFTRLFAARLLTLDLPADVDALKVDVPSDATPTTPWRITRLSRRPYYIPVKPERVRLSDEGVMDYVLATDLAEVEPDSDVRALVHDRAVSVTPLSLDLTSRVDFSLLARLLAGGGTQRADASLPPRLAQGSGSA